MPYTITFRRGGQEVVTILDTPVCLECKHPVCPCCLYWCDELIPDPDSPGEYTVCNCERCVYEPGAIEAFTELIPDAWDGATGCYR